MSVCVCVVNVCVVNVCVDVDFIASYMWKLDTEMVGFPHKKKEESKLVVEGEKFSF